MIGRFKSLEEYIQSEFVEAALNGLIVNGCSSDIRFGRQYLKSEDQSTKLAAVRIVSRFGTADDVSELLQISHDDWGDVRDEAGACALRLSTNPFEVARDFTHSASAKLVQAGFGWLYDHASPEVNTFFEELLDDEKDKNRLRSVYYFSKSLKDEELAQILKVQFDNGTYYYNVVTWLDRLLYAPAPLKEFFVRELKRQATS